MDFDEISTNFNPHPLDFPGRKFRLEIKIQEVKTIKLKPKRKGQHE